MYGRWIDIEYNSPEGKDDIFVDVYKKTFMTFRDFNYQITIWITMNIEQIQSFKLK